MTETVSPPVVGQDPWGEDLNAYLAFVEGRVVSMEEQPNGAVMAFNFSPGPEARTTAFGPGEIRFDNEDQTQARSIMVSTVTGTGADARLALLSAVPGTVLVIQQTTDVKQYALATMSGDGTDMGDHFVLPIASLELAAEPLLPGQIGLSAAGITPASGPAGPQGPAGVQGPQGIPGLQGAPGPEGEPGPQGASGAEGPVGPQGQQGDLGPEGPQGMQGISVGAAAFDWSNNNIAADPGVGGVRCNTTIPSDSTEWYVSRYDKSGAVVRFAHLAPGITFLIYESKKYNTWDRYEVTGDAIDMGEWLKVPVAFVESGPQPFNPGGNAVVQIESEAGQQEGPQGPAGPQGPQGALGPTGPSGAQGVPGATGPEGPEGPQGIPGVEGSQGPIGPQGVQGQQGPKGDKGDTGNTGASGATGPQGLQGNPGAPGTTGATGATGAAGAIGPMGPQGPAGTIVVAQSTTRVVVVNTAAESSLGDVAIGPIAAGAVYSLDMWGDILNSAANYGYTFRLRQGGLTGALLFDMAAQAMASNASPRSWSTRILLIGVTATAIDLSMTHALGAANAPTRMSTPTINNGVNPGVAGFNAATTLTLTVQIATANANANARLLGYFLRKIG